MILFSKKGGRYLSRMVETGADGIGLDWTADIKHAREKYGRSMTFQGNLDPCVLYSSEENIEKEVKRLLKNVGYGSGHIFNLGHGIYPDIPVDSMKVLVESVKKYSPAYHVKESACLIK